MTYLAALALAAAFIKRDLRREAFRLCRIPFEAAASSGAGLDQFTRGLDRRAGMRADRAVANGAPFAAANAFDCRFDISQRSPPNSCGNSTEREYTRTPSICPYLQNAL